MNVRRSVAVVVAVLLIGALSVFAQDAGNDGSPGPGPRFDLRSTQPISGGSLSVIRDNRLPNRPCFYLFQSQWGTQMMPTPGGAC